MQGSSMKRSPGKAFLPREFGIDPDRQNLEDGSWLWPTIRQTVGYSSPERRLERAIVKELLNHPEASRIVLSSLKLRKILGESWQERITCLGCEGLRRVSHLVGESCVRVSIKFSNGSLVTRVY